VARPSELMTKRSMDGQATGDPATVPCAVNSMMTPSVVAPQRWTEVVMSGMSVNSCSNESWPAARPCVVGVMGAERRTAGSRTVFRRSGDGARQKSSKRRTKSEAADWSMGGILEGGAGGGVHVVCRASVCVALALAGVTGIGCGSSGATAGSESSGASVSQPISRPASVRSPSAATSPSPSVTAAGSGAPERAERGHETLETYGRAASGAESTGIAGVVESYYAAYIDGDGGKACALVSGELERIIVKDLAKRLSGAAGTTCSSVLSGHGQRIPESVREEFRGLRVTRVRVQGTHGLAFIASRAIPYGVMSLEREGGAWKVAEYEATTLMRPGGNG